MPRQRDYAAEYARRSARARAEGKSFFQKRQARELAAPEPVHHFGTQQDAQWHKAYRTLLDMEKGVPLGKAARGQHTTPAQVRKYMKDRLEQKGKRWTLSEEYLRHEGMAVQIITSDGFKQVFISDPLTRAEYSTYLNYVKEVLRAQPLPNSIIALDEFKGKTFTDANGKKHKFVTDRKVLKKLYDDGKIKGMEEFYVEISR